jgi:hypothetical protein
MDGAWKSSRWENKQLGWYGNTMDHTETAIDATIGEGGPKRNFLNRS